MTLLKARAQRALLVAVALAAASAATATPGAAQFTTIPEPAVYGIRNATVTSADGTRRTGVNVVVRGSFIEAIAPGAVIPAGAQVIDGDSLYLYPGIVDAGGAVKYTFPRDSVDRARVRSWDPPRSVQGFLPSRRVAAYLQPGPTEIADLRKKGVVAVAILPTDMIMPGQGVLLMLRSETDPQRLVITPSLGAVMSMRPARGVYPATGMGLAAFYRQTFLDTQRMAGIARSIATDPRGVVPPAYDADYAVVQQALDGTMPVYFAANTLEEILGAIRIADEFKLRPTIIGGAEAWRAAAELKARNIPVLISLDFPKPKQWKPAGAKPDSAATRADSAATPDADTTTAEPTPGALREKADLENMYANPGRLAKAGVRFALTSGGGKADIRDAARKPIEFGLSETDALRAITATPAQVLGVPSLGRIEPGLPASFVIMNRPIFQKDAKVLYTFVDGTLEKGGTTPPAARPGATGNKADTGYNGNGGAR